MTTFQITDTAAATCSAGNFCSGNSTTGDTTSFQQASEGGSAGVGNDSYGVVQLANNHDTIFYEIIDGTNNLEDLDGATGNWD